MARARNSYFQFKQFRIEQDQCAMKVCTDACVFGALMDPGGARSILDIGTGTGLLALMLAQKSPRAKITAIEMDPAAAQQAEANFAASPFATRLSIVHARIQDFAAQADSRYDFICSNPPFFLDAVKSSDQQRRLARHTDSLSIEDLVQAIRTLLAPGGRFYVHWPIEEGRRFAQLAREQGLAIEQRIALRHNDVQPDTRYIFRGSVAAAVLTAGLVAPAESVIAFRTLDDRDYTPTVRSLLAPFYASIT